MSLNSKISGLNGRLLTGSKMKKAKQPLRGTNSGWKWKRLLIFVWVLLVTIGFGLYLLNGAFRKKIEIAALKCTKEFGNEMSTKHEITSSLKVLDYEQNVEIWGQCPVHYDKAPMVHSSSTHGKLAREDNGILKVCVWALFIVSLCSPIPCLWMNRKDKMVNKEHKQSSSRSAGKWMKKLLVLFVFVGVTLSIWLFWYLKNIIVV